MHTQILIFMTSACCFLALNVLRLCKLRLLSQPPTSSPHSDDINLMSPHRGLQDEELVRLDLKVMSARSAKKFKASSVSEHSFGAIATTSFSYSIANEVEQCAICV